MIGWTKFQHTHVLWINLWDFHFNMTWVILNVLTGETITGGKLVIDVSYFGWHIHSETHDLCEESSCPVSSGDFVISHTQVLPGFTPPVSILSTHLFHFSSILDGYLITWLLIFWVYSNCERNLWFSSGPFQRLSSQPH